MTDTATYTATFTQTYTMTATPTITYTPTITPTRPPFPYNITVGVYNSAGELVRTVVESPASVMMTGAFLYYNGTVDPSLMTAEMPLLIGLPGVETPGTLGDGGTFFEWHAINNQGQPVLPGIYYIKVEMKDGYGHVNVVTKEILFLRTADYLDFNVFNSAGELVRSIRIYDPTADTVKLNIDDLLIIEKGGSSLNIEYGAGGYLQWDGKNSHGKTVNSGTYELQVIMKKPDGTRVEASKTVIILNQGFDSFLADVKAFPNPFNGEKSETMRFDWQGSSGTGQVKIRIFDVSGAIVAMINAGIEDGYVDWNVKTPRGRSIAPGIYMAVIEAENGEGYTERKLVKIAVLGRYLSDW